VDPSTRPNRSSEYNVFDNAFGVSQLKKIADADGLFPHQNPALNKVVNDIFVAPETKANGNRADKKAKRGDRTIK